MEGVMRNIILKKFIIFGLVLSFFILAFHPITSKSLYQFNEEYKINNNLKYNTNNILNPDIEGDHFPCGVEYWWLYTILNLEDGRQWDMCAQFFYVMNWTGSNWSETDGISYIRIQSWDRETGEYFDCFYESKHPGVFQHKKNMVDLKYYNSTMKGLYPNYTAHFDDDINNIILDTG